jgi:hypothetical protein
MRRFSALAALLLAGCIFVPQTQTYYDTECQVETREMTLVPAQLGYFHGGCRGRDCAYALVAIGAVAAASVVVSGSIVVVHNTVTWVEKQGKCTGLL